MDQAAPIALQQIQLNPLPPPGPQPDFGNLRHHLDGVREELSHFENLPGIAEQQGLQHLNNSLQAVVQGLNQLVVAVQNIQAS
jgi:hypothetical protein